jgi:hypothetical protein
MHIFNKTPQKEVKTLEELYTEKTYNILLYHTGTGYSSIYAG